MVIGFGVPATVAQAPASERATIPKAHRRHRKPARRVDGSRANTWPSQTGARRRQLEQKHRMLIFWQAMTG